MLQVFLAVVIAATALFAGANAQLVMNTPTGVTQCQPILLSWTGGTAPYYLSLYPGGQPNGSPLFDFGKQNGTSLTWIVNYPTGTSLGLNLRDSTGAVSQTAAFTVGTSSDTSCLSSSVVVSTRSGVSTTSTTGVIATTTAGGTTLTTTTKLPTNTGTSPASGSSPSTSPSPSPSSSANKVVANCALVGAVAAVSFALFA